MECYAAISYCTALVMTAQTLAMTAQRFVITAQTLSCSTVISTSCGAKGSELQHTDTILQDNDFELHLIHKAVLQD